MICCSLKNQKGDITCQHIDYTAMCCKACKVIPSSLIFAVLVVYVATIVLTNRFKLELDGLQCVWRHTTI